jgi:hypothetical protein
VIGRQVFYDATAYMRLLARVTSLIGPGGPTPARLLVNGFPGHRYHRQKDLDTVAYFRAKFRAGEPVAPVWVIVQGYEVLLWDGHHRVEAARAEGVREVEAVRVPFP